MNIFFTDADPVQAAINHCDKHVVKMVVESAQMLSTAHRMLDGTMTTSLVTTKTGLRRKRKDWSLADVRDSILYKVAHPSHPSTKWTMLSAANYDWHYRLFIALCDEYTFRYRKIHKTDALLRSILANRPLNIADPENPNTTQFALAMKSNPECIDHSDPIGSYRKFYKTKRDRFKMVWTARNIPEWFL